jgi:DNA polymerase elongation subunit (family B)
MWNQTFDIRTSINRIRQKDYDEKEIICPNDFEYKKVYYKTDHWNQSPTRNSSYADITSYTNFIDQMNLYANLRSFTKKESYSLDYTAENEIGFKKVELPDNVNMKNFPYKDFRKFMKYSMVDTFLLYLLEKKNKDFDTLYEISMMTKTRITHALKKTICLKNLGRDFYKQQGFIMSNNHNKTYGSNNKENFHFRGAFVANPNLNKPMGIELNGSPSKFIYKYVNDFDLSSLYPSIILAFNISEVTQYGKIILNQENEDGELEDVGYKFVDNLISKDWTGIGNKWFNLPTIKEVVNEIEG